MDTCRLIIGNALPASVLLGPQGSSQIGRLALIELSAAEAADLVADAQADPNTEIVSVWGHENSAALASAALNYEVAPNRVSLPEDTLSAPGTCLLAGCYAGPRLDEGAHVLPPGATLRWVAVTLEANLPPKR